jgi:hypothetical protein
MRKSTWDLTRQLVAAAVLTAVAVAAMIAGAGQAGAADLVVYPQQRTVIAACGPQEVVVIFIKNRPTIPARTPYFTCLTGTTLLPGTIPPPPEYCCS